MRSSLTQLSITFGIPGSSKEGIFKALTSGCARNRIQFRFFRIQSEGAQLFLHSLNLVINYQRTGSVPHRNPASFSGRICAASFVFPEEAGEWAWKEEGLSMLTVEDFHNRSPEFLSGFLVSETLALLPLVSLSLLLPLLSFLVFFALAVFGSRLQRWTLFQLFSNS